VGATPVGAASAAINFGPEGPPTILGPEGPPTILGPEGPPTILGPEGPPAVLVLVEIRPDYNIDTSIVLPA